ncbi:dipeptidyl carboxypeptidase Dcp [Klebsiella pneumoniae subsp. ozaenae]|uniref:Dipeptidyl carboxypeptidase Dcp n=1 Tax=Klebsiella pneumoniae subsp. ozaenae TaxID=574 RepID=A0A378B1S9_KLEPO|nr:dipeptidyl carboxypeptidase Dcp [Klebsiella pneumoniae subsp. ozaenae]
MTSGLMRPCFSGVNSVYEQRDALALDSESYRLLTLTWQRFVHAGGDAGSRAAGGAAHT